MKIYGQGAELLPALTEAQFLRLLGIWFICEYTRDRWKQEVENTPSEALERRWMVFFAVGESLRQVHERLNESLDHVLQKLANPAWYLEADSCLQKAVLKRHCKLGFTALKNAYNEVKGQKDFRHRNWFRTQIHWNQCEYSWQISGTSQVKMLRPTPLRIRNDPQPPETKSLSAPSNL